MNFVKYPAYKDSGVEWLGEIPEHWEVAPLKFYASCNDSTLPETTDEDFEIEYVEISDVDEIAGIRGSSFYRFSEAPSRARRIVQKGDTLVSTVRTYLRAIAPVEDPAENLIASTGFAVIRPRTKYLDGRFTGYLLRAEWLISEVIARSVGVSYPAINASDLIALKVPAPKMFEQTQIARFLDHETARIDALIEEQQRLIELLKEKRQAVISHAVTKGLDPSVPMKDSGVEWLGKVPAHWDVSPLKYLVSFRSGGTPSKENLDYWDGDIPWASAKDLKQEVLADTIDHITEFAIESGAASLVPAGSILIVVRGMILARIFPVVEALVPMAINQDLKAVIPNERIYGKYLAVLFRGSSLESLSRLDEAGHGTKALRMESWSSMELPVPPVKEQISILGALDRETARLDSLIEGGERNIELLQERRSALISAAVTGKIDLRGWQPPAGTPTPLREQETA